MIIHKSIGTHITKILFNVQRLQASDGGGGGEVGGAGGGASQEDSDSGDDMIGPRPPAPGQSTSTLQSQVSLPPIILLL